MNNDLKKKYFVKYIILIIGLVIMAFGVAFSIKANLGTSPISSLPYVSSLLLSLTVGQLTIIMHVLFIILQIVLLKNDYDKIQLLQLPVALIFGYLTDFAVNCTSNLFCSSYYVQWIFCIIGIILVGLGVSLEVAANVVTLAGEGLVLAICKKFNLKFSIIKIIFDSSLVLISIILSLVFLKELKGVREGTIAAAICVGIVAKLFNKIFNKILVNN